MVFYPDSLTKSGGKKVGYERPKLALSPEDCDDRYSCRGLYNSFYRNVYGPILEVIDTGYEWAGPDSGATKLAQWPATIFIQGDKDLGLDINVTIDVVSHLGPNKAKLIIAEGQNHLFEAIHFLEDEGVGMDAVRQAVQLLDEAILSQAHKP